MDILQTPLTESGSITFYSYGESHLARWFGLISAAAGFAVALLKLWEVLSAGVDFLDILFGTLGLAWGLLWLLASLHTNPRHFEISELGITSFNDHGEIVAFWDEVRKAEKFKSRIDRRPRVHFHTAAGDFIVYSNLRDFDRFIEDLALHIPDRLFEGRDKSWLWRATCSNCGGEFSGNACPHCQQPITQPNSKPSRR